MREIDETQYLDVREWWVEVREVTNEGGEGHGSLIISIKIFEFFLRFFEI